MGVSGAAVLGASAGDAGAAAGDLTNVDCIGDIGGCISTTPTPTALDGAAAVAISSDQRQLYVAAFGGSNPGGNAISHFTIDSAGNLTFMGCIGDLSGCTPTSPAGALDGATALLLSGSNLYAADSTGNNLSHLTLDAAGNLTFMGCIGDLSGCTPTSPATAVDFAVGVGRTPDGKQLYVAANNDVSHFTLDGAGNPSFSGCIGDLSGCTPTSPTGALDQAEQVAISPSGGQLYASAWAGNPRGDISHFTIDSAGNLTFMGCIGSFSGCTSVSPSAALDTPFGMAQSPDGSRLYAASFGGGALSELTIDGGGTPSFARCIGRPSGCVPTSSSKALSGSLGVTLSPDAKQLYVASENPGAINHFTIDGAGDPSFAGCVGVLVGCSGVNPSAAIAFSRWVAITPDGTQLYDAAANLSGTDGSVSHFTIEQPPPNPSNAFSFGKLQRDVKRGTATLTVFVPGPGEISLGGSSVQTQGHGRMGSGAKLSRAVGPPWAITLEVVPKGQVKRKLRKRGKAFVTISITFTPTAGESNTQSKTIKLIKRRSSASHSRR